MTGVVSPRLMLTNAGARPGDVLILTKPLGTGVVTTAIKRGLAPAALRRKAIAVMKHLNTAGPDIAERRLARAAVDITGFGLLGHLDGDVPGERRRRRDRRLEGPRRSHESVFELIAAGCVPGGSRDNRAEASRFTEWDGVSEGMPDAA